MTIKPSHSVTASIYKVPLTSRQLPVVRVIEEKSVTLFSSHPIIWTEEHPHSSNDAENEFPEKNNKRMSGKNRIRLDTKSRMPGAFLWLQIFILLNAT
jgi:hypothetical protein